MTEIYEINIQSIYDRADNLLKTNHRITFLFDRNWSKNFPCRPGVYAVFYQQQLIYIGESANIRERMKEFKRTVNHSFRRKLGRFLDPNAIIERGKFTQELEARLNIEYESHISVSFIEVNFGRIEIENYLMQINEGVLNSIGNRSRI